MSVDELHKKMLLYYRIKEQRSRITAPVDMYGCSVVSKCCTEKYKFSILVSLLLSSQTKDEVTWAAVQNLDAKILGGLTIEGICNQSIEFINSCISKVGFHNKKSHFLKQIACILIEKGLPESLDDLIKLPGIGYKMAILYLYHACRKIEGISVDTHVHRIANRIGLVKTRSPEQTRKRLQEIMPKSEWAEVNSVLVGFGQVICRPVNPKCSECDIHFDCGSAKKYEF
eukprot:jgi/Antlo1/1721/1872